MDFMSISDQWIRATLDFFRRTLDKNFFTTQEENFERAASWAAPLSAVLGLLFSLVAAIKGDSFRIFLLGIVWVFVVCIGYFIGKQFVAACRKMILNNPSTISSGAFLELMVDGLLRIIYHQFRGFPGNGGTASRGDAVCRRRRVALFVH